MKFTRLFTVSLLAMTAASPALAENVLRWTSQGDALTMDPHSQNEGPTIAMNGQIYESLVTRDADLTLQPELAESWEAGSDGWTFKLRKGVKFHDGADFTAEDVVFSFERANHEASDYKEQAKNVTSVEVIDDYTVKLMTDGPNPILPNQLTSIYMMDKGWSEANNVTAPQDFKAKEETYAVRNANGTGPFSLVSRAPDELTVLERNAAWWGNDMFPGNIDKIEYRPISNAATRVAALLSGEVDFVLDPPLQDLKRIEAADGLGVKTVAQIRSIFFGMDQGVDKLRSSDVDGNPFKDKRVREAFNLAIDKAAIQRVVMEGLSFPTGMITPPGVLGNTPDNDASYGFDPEKAKSLLTEAGYPDGFSIQLDCPNNRYNNDEKICQAAVAMLAKIGVKVNLDAIPKAQHFPKIQKRESDFYMLGWGVPTLDSHYVFSYLLDGEGSWNATGYDNARVNEITDAITTEIDIDKRTALIDEAWDLVKADIPYVPIHHQVLAWGISDKVDIAIAADDAFRPRFAVMK
ncbi:ABC transporter substrate-binding protein [Phaeobacter gallaeciensis]|jgi:peptide/nickel transport system substrate-binding protein|uniref:ABC transporter substrate-binding protein n=1 Tax=Phaeobacter gallaeciensis TaxID=60890 RepID=UPI00237F4EE1|nr:ABC transporter substrate-binding protein [Phaeobacter gallaeciensis]MDE4272751.1 ABC transporter substrate-binding protein [Phaeobacter gallaeciensis]MDE4298296.1 ABC transporter substrate-binding protein [Phaeobacter gallaeciensis]MDE4304501.1 ABC transporter substrate-binding protein [Phaeobacter gallaeciensis]MDE4308156.1 ABC transporter substrate-binding protein [Phaeobacter gallaeciensis]MDE4312613.1 ABC transporter substrate-binding protein [Phaeobacter gallaeciensis]